MSAVEWWAEGRKREVAEYCKDDVKGLISLLEMGKFAFPVKKWKASSTSKTTQEIVSWSELNWNAYLASKVPQAAVSQAAVSWASVSNS